MKYLDSFGIELHVDDYVIYGVSGFLRISKIIDIKPTVRHGGIIQNHYTLVVMTATDTGTFKRESCTWHRLGSTEIRFWSVVKVDNIPPEYEDRIEKRLARDK